MDYQTFRGSDVQEALFAVRQALGADALIESTRHVTNGQAGAFGRSFVEVTAAPNKGTLGNKASDSRSIKRRGLGNDRSGSKRGRKVDPKALEQELLALRRMVDELTAGRPPRERARAMIHSAGFHGEIAKSLGTGATKAAKSGREELARWLRGRLADRLMCQPHLIQRNFRQVIACVGPTGVGKTTTLAKLAARAKLELHKSVSVISLDTFRVGAVEQWTRYAELVGIGFEVAEDSTMFQRLVESQPSDLILVDTAGQSTHDDVGMLRLADCLNSVRRARTEVQLVLPAWIGAQDAERVARSYQNPRLTGLIVTKMDEAEHVGGCLQAALANQLPVTYLCDGARVPEDIHDAVLDAVLDVLFPEQA